MRDAIWRKVCAAADMDEEDVLRFDVDDRSFAVYCTEAGAYYATDGFCTHEKQHLEDGLVIDDVIECPLHQGRFHIPTGKALGAPVCVNLKIWPCEVRDGDVWIQA